MKNILRIISFLFLLTLAVACNKNLNPPDQSPIIELPPIGAAVITANNQFAFDFFHQTIKSDENKNTLISPLSIYMALSMVYNGADNATKDSMEKTLKLTGIDLETLNSVNKTLISFLPKEDSKVKLDIANSIWYRQNAHNPLPDFLNTTRDNYSATVQSLDFDDPHSVNIINQWVSDKTQKKITNIIDKISSNDLMFLINAIYFKGSWKLAFKKSETQNDIFHLSDGATKSVPFMNQEITTNLFNNDLFSMLELPYGNGKSFSMYLLKPSNSESYSIESFASSINQNSISTAIHNMDSAKVSVQIPKWKYSFEIKDMKSMLANLGMGIAFGDGADFSKMYNPAEEKVSITKAIHKTFIDVNEEGTEAAAVTGIGMGTTAVTPSIVFKLDHPFIYLIVEKQTGAVLFFGSVEDPS